MKNWTLILTIFFASSLALADEAIISVSGVAERFLEPNFLTLRLEVWGKAATAKQAQLASAEQFKLLKTQVDQFKVKKEDFQSEQYQLVPEYHYGNNQPPTISGYRAAQNVIVILRKLDDVGGFLDAAIGATKSASKGVSVLGMQWDSDKREQTELALLPEAVKNAQSKAALLAKASGVKLKRLYRLSDSKTEVAFPMPRGNIMAKSMMAAEANSTELAVGQIKVVSEVQAQYEVQ